jgi:hypothetical protein
MHERCRETFGKRNEFTNEFTNDGKSNEFTNDGKRIKWSDTFEMLKLYIKCCVNETGVWSAPGGKYKKFCSTSTDLALSWNYELGTLSFKGKVGAITSYRFLNH